MYHVTFVAVRHGVILGAGETPAAAAAAAASQVLRCEVRLATPHEERFWRKVRGRKLPAGDRALLEAIRVDANRLAGIIDCFLGGCDCGGPRECVFFPNPTIAELRPEHFLWNREGDAHECVEEIAAVIRAIDEELADLDVTDRQASLFEALPA